MDKVNAALQELQNETVQFYLHMMDKTETPPLFHVWSLLSAAGACMTRRCWFPLGEMKVMPNMYVMLVGAPGVRKSTAINFARKLVADIEGIRFAPNSTGGHLQGFVSAMNEQKHREEEEDKGINEAISEMGKFDIQGLTNEEMDDIAPTHVMNRSALYVAEGELTGFLGKKQDTFINFLGDMWDKSGDLAHVYQIKREKLEVKLPCVNMIGGITPVHITSYLPIEAVGQGFTSRIMLVYSDYRKNVPWPEPLNAESLRQIKKIMRWIFEVKEGAFEFEDEVKDAIIRLYSYRPAIEDARFIHYAERRQSHLIKAAMALCALRMSNVMSVADIEDAHKLLVLTELKMTESLGEYGLTPMALARTRIGDLLRRSDDPMTLQRILMACGSDLNRADITRALSEMVLTKQVIEVTLRDANGAQTTGFARPMERNPFKTGETINVNYLVKDLEGDASKTVKKLGMSLDAPPPPEIRKPQPVLRAAITERLSAMPEPGETDMKGRSLADQGYASIQEKLNAIVRRVRQ